LLFTFGIVAIAPTPGRAQIALPEKGGEVTLVGCFQRGIVEHGKEKFVITSPTTEPVNSVTESTCSASGQMVRLHDLHRVGLDESMLGRWIEISGRLEGNDPYPEIKEVHLKSFRVIPVVPPPVAAAPAPIPQIAEAAPVAPPYVAPAPVPAPAPVATTGTVRTELPKSGTQLPLVGLIGLVSLAAGLTLRLFGGPSLGRS